MSDLISAQESVAKIVGTAIRKISSGEQKLTKEYEKSVIEAVDEILNTARRERCKAEAQAEIVRCKECKHHRYDRGIPYCDRIDYGYGWEDDEYCSRAERRTDGQHKEDS